MKSYIKQSLSILSLITALSVTVALSGCGSKSSTSSSATSASVVETTGHRLKRRGRSSRNYR